MNFNWCFFQYTSLDILDSQIPGDDVLSGGCSADAEINKTRLLLPNLVFRVYHLTAPWSRGSGNEVGLNAYSAIKLAVFFIHYVSLFLQELTEHFHPVFRHFFLEKFPDPAVWFERRLSYTRGVATSSIGILIHFVAQF